MLTTYLWVALGSALGGMARYAIVLATVKMGGGVFPWGTLGINMLGSFIIGLVFALTLPDGALSTGMNFRAFVMTGLCGGFTTFSAFSLQSLQLLRDGYYKAAIAYMIGSVGLCVMVTALGFWIGHRPPPLPIDDTR